MRHPTTAGGGVAMNSEIDWWRDTNPEAEALSAAVLDCIGELGIDGATMVALAARLGHSRAGMFRKYAHRSVVFSETFAHVLRTLDARCRRVWALPSRREQFERIWNELLDFLTSPRGAAFLSLRGALAAASSGSLDRLGHEPSLLQHLTAWLADDYRDANPRAHALWCLMLAAARSDAVSREHHALRDLAWELVDAPADAPDADTVDLDVDAADVTLLGPLLTSFRSPPDGRCLHPSR